MFTYFLTNLIFEFVKPIKSSVTNTCPSQWTEEPIPIVGILASFVIFLDRSLATHSIECVASDLSKKITKEAKIPTIGIGSSVHCDGQVLVTDDLIGLTNSKIKFVKKYVNTKSLIKKGAQKFRSEVLKKKYPTKKYSY